MAFKSEDGVETRKVLLTLDEETVSTFKEVGGGNMSLGARRLAERHNSPAPVAEVKSISKPVTRERRAATATRRADGKLKEERKPLDQRIPAMQTAEQFLEQHKRDNQIQKGGVLLWSRTVEPLYQEYVAAFRKQWKLDAE